MIADPEPTCGPPNDNPIQQGDTVTLTCTMVVYYRSELGQRPRAFQTPTTQATIAWAAAAGTAGTAAVTSQADDSLKLEIDVTPDTSGTEIPSFTCTSTFTFTDPGGTEATTTLATNDLQYACSSARILLWCTYLLVS